MSPVITVTRAELEDRRRALLAELGTSLEDFARLAATRTLTGAELDAKEELDEIAFLLGSSFPRVPESLNDESLEDASARFATEVQETLDGVLPGTRTIVSRRSEDGARFLVQPDERRGIALLVGGEPLAQLSLAIYLGLDRTGRYLKAVRSDFVVSSVLDRTPLIRLDYRADMTTAAVAHWQVHAERGAFSHLLARAHAVDSTRVGKPHELSSLHIPVGGERYRPCLEDLLHFLVQECGVDRHDDWLTVVERGRESWRRRQLASAVRDAPAYAATVLQELGWTVEPPPIEPLENIKALRRW